MNLIGKKICLRAMELEDMELLRSTINDPQIERLVGGWSFPVSKYEQNKGFENAVIDKTNIRLIIESIADKNVLGMISLMEIDWKNRTASYAIKLKSDAPKQKGIASDSEFTLFRFAFEELQLHRLSSEVIEYNTASIAMTEKCGAKREGVKRSAVYKNGKYHDVICYGVLYDDYVNAAESAGWL